MVISSLYDSRLFENNCVLRADAYYYREWKQFSMDPHSHDRAEIMYVISGKCTVSLDHTELSMKKGDMVLLDANVRHKLTVGPGMPCRMLNVEFVFEEDLSGINCFRQLLKNNGDVERLLHSKKPCFFIKDAGEIYPVLKDLILELDNVFHKNTFTIQLLFSLLLAKISVQASQPVDFDASSEKIYVRNALQFIHNFYDRDLKAEDIAESVSLHPSYLQRIFKKNTGVTLTVYLTHFRMEKAKMLLRQTDIPIIDIAGYVGVNSRQYFTSIFRKCTGKSPKDYRKENIDKRNVRISDIPY